MKTDVSELFEPIRRIHEAIRAKVVAACEAEPETDLAAIAEDGDGDTIFAIDRISEDLLVDLFEKAIASHVPIVLIAEGIESGKLVLPRGTSEAEAVWRIIVDPIDGTRGLMYQKRSAWILTGVARNRGTSTSIADIEFAIQTEIPLVKQHLSDVLWAFAGRGASAQRYDRLNDSHQPISLSPSKATSIEQGFAMIARFFPGSRELLAAIDEEIVRGALGPPRDGKAQCFEDQYISTGGQLYELIAGHDRFVADLRPFTQSDSDRRGFGLSICCHPYDLCTELIAREFGIIVTDVRGGRIAANLDVDSNVAWAGYANDSIRNQIEPLLLGALETRGILEGS